MNPISFQSSNGDTIAGNFFAAARSSPAPCLLICHGAFESRDNFLPFGQQLADNGISTLVLDMPGHGQSMGERHAIDISAWVDAISAGIDTISELPDVESGAIGLFGFSSGGTAALEAALTEPRIKAIATLDATVQNYMGLWDTLFFKLLIGLGHMKLKLTGRQWRPNLSRVLKNAQVAFDPEINQEILSNPQLIEAYAAMPLPAAAPCAFVDTIKRVSEIRVPTLIMHGQEDHIDNVETAHLLYEQLTCEKALEIIPESGHCGHLDTHKERIMHLTEKWMSTHLANQAHHFS